jgi:hypothetical protein
LADYALELKYENLDDEIEGGVNFIRRIGQASQDTFVGPPAGQAIGMSYNTWDLYGKKRLGRLTLGGELPIVSGTIGGGTYSTWALAAEADWKMSDSWDSSFRAGHAPGQPDSSTQTVDQFKAFYMNPNYKLGLIMFNYQLANFAGPNTLNNPGTSPSALKSPYDNPISNANYLSAGTSFHTDKWDFHTNWIFARANETAHAASAFYYNRVNNRYEPTGGGDQGSWLGWEMDYGATFQWDDNFQFGLDTGFYFPGSFYEYSATPTLNKTDTVWATVARVGVSF